MNVFCMINQHLLTKETLIVLYSLSVLWGPSGSDATSVSNICRPVFDICFLHDQRTVKDGNAALWPCLCCSGSWFQCCWYLWYSSAVIEWLIVFSCTVVLVCFYMKWLSGNKNVTDIRPVDVTIVGSVVCERFSCSHCSVENDRVFASWIGLWWLRRSEIT